MKDPAENTLIFAKYFTALNQRRAVDPKEIVMMFAYFNECQKQDIDLTDDYINELAFFVRDYFCKSCGSSRYRRCSCYFLGL